MQYLTLLAAATAASASAIPRSTTFSITNFAFAGTPHSVIAHYELNTTDGSAASTLCQTTTNTSPSITYFPLTGCADPSWSFSWQDYPAQANSSVVTVTHAVGGGAPNVTAQRIFSYSDVKQQEGTTPTGNTDYLDSGSESRSFKMTAN